MKLAARQLILCNDDGIDAPGLAALKRAAERLAPSRVVAPVGPWSGRGHAITTHEPIPILRMAEDRFAVEGTPADCVRLALHHLAPGADWLLAGINRGGNLGTDIHHSGTVAAVREAVIHGTPGIALSHYIARGRQPDWDRASAWAALVLEVLFRRPWTPGTFWNVNFPHPEPGVSAQPEIVDCPLDPSPLPLSYRVEPEGALYDGDYQSRARQTGADVDLCFSGRITVSLVPLIPPAEHDALAPARDPAGHARPDV
ncbi:5'/3'-nucleotidase SurE [soil metagenome]